MSYMFQYASLETGCAFFKDEKNNFFIMFWEEHKNDAIEIYKEIEWYETYNTILNIPMDEDCNIIEKDGAVDYESCSDEKDNVVSGVFRHFFEWYVEKQISGHVSNAMN